jgi:hypothetical protein
MKASILVRVHKLCNSLTSQDIWPVTLTSLSTLVVQRSLSEQRFRILLVQADIASHRKAHAASRAPQRNLELRKTLNISDKDERTTLTTTGEGRLR